jgi:hypothetical protein
MGTRASQNAGLEVGSSFRETKCQKVTSHGAQSLQVSRRSNGGACACLAVVGGRMHPAKLSTVATCVLVKQSTVATCAPARPLTVETCVLARPLTAETCVPGKVRRGTSQRQCFLACPCDDFQPTQWAMEARTSDLDAVEQTLFLTWAVEYLLRLPDLHRAPRVLPRVANQRIAPIQPSSICVRGTEMPRWLAQPVPPLPLAI